MKKFGVYKDANDSYELIKEGWNWPAFFFGAFWALSKKLWIISIGIFLALFCMLLLFPNDTAASIFGWIQSIVLGYYGNKAVVLDRKAKGYKLQEYVEATNKNAAFIKVAVNQNKEN